MNAERLHSIVAVLSKEMAKRKTSENMEALVNALESVVNQPSPDHQKNLSNSLKAMYEALADTPSDSFSPAWRQILGEIGGDYLSGSYLKETIESIFQENQLTPAVALEELKKILKALQLYKKALENSVAAFRHFEIGSEDLEPGKCEIGMLIPRGYVNNELLNFSEELKELSFILNTFSEVATGNTDHLVINTISSSDFMVYLDAVPTYAACLAVAIERIVTLYKQLLEIRKLHAELGKQGVPGERTIGIEAYANELMQTGIEKTSTEIVDKFYKKTDPGRKNELKIKVNLSLNKIANRIDRGFNIEVRAESPKPAEEGKIDEKLQKEILIIHNASKNMQFLNLEGNPVLKLPETLKLSEPEPKVRKIRIKKTKGED